MSGVEQQKVPEGYKHTEAGIIPNDWETKPLGKLVNSVEYGSSAKSNQSGTMPVLRMGNLQSGKIDWNDLVYTSDKSEIERYELKKNDVLFNRTNTVDLVGKTSIFKGERPAVFAGYLIRINRIEDQLDADYLNYILNSYQSRKYSKQILSVAVSQANINGQKLKTYPIPTPPTIQEQTAIANALSDVDALITSLEKLVTKMRAIKTAAMQQLLTGKKRLPPFDQIHTGYKQTELGEIPEGWECKLLPDLVVNGSQSIKIGPFGSALKKEYLTKDGYKVYGQENVYDKDMDVGNRYINREHYYQLKSCCIKPGDFLISMMGTVGKCFIVPEGIHEGIMDSHLLRLRVDSGKLDKSLLIQFFQSPLVLRQIKQLSVGGIMEGLSSKIIKSIAVPVGSIEEQVLIAQTLQSMDQGVDKLEQRLTKTQNLKQGMMQELLKGRARLV